jgi:hypothetical protein
VLSTKHTRWRRWWRAQILSIAIVRHVSSFKKILDSNIEVDQFDASHKELSIAASLDCHVTYAHLLLLESVATNIGL